MAGQDARRITADAEEGCVAERHEATETERQIETERCQRQNGDAGGERHVKRLAECIGRERSDQQQKGKHKIDGIFACQHFFCPHACAGGKSPRGLTARMTAMTT
ncbi:hypothetical protein D3C73_1043180 [compost metagenome]